MTFDIFAWHRELLGAELTKGEFKALVSLSTFADKDGVNCVPTAEQVSERANVGLRVVYKSWASAVAADLLIKTQRKHKSSTFQLVNAPQHQRWIPTKKNKGIRPNEALHAQTPSLARRCK